MVAHPTPAPSLTHSSVRPFAVRRFGLFILLNILGVAALVVIHIGVGSVAIAPHDVVATLLERPNDPLHYTIVHDLRLPRALIAVVVGAMLGLSGGLLQGVTRNPLASPALTGVLSGGVLAMVVWASFGPADLQSGRALPIIAIAGGLIAGLLVYAVSWQGGTDPIRLTLGGVLVAAVLNAIGSLLLLVDQRNMGVILTWIIGSLNGRVWVHWYTLAPYALVAIPLGLAMAGVANVLNLGDETAAGLGIRVETARAALLLVAVILAAGAVSVVGNITFIGLIAPHIARRIVGGDYRRLLPTSAVLAAGLLVGADILARTATLKLAPDSAIGVSNLPVGAVTAVLGAIFFFYLLTRKAA